LSDTPPTAPAHDGIAPIAIEDELKRSYLDYAMSVIVSRALPDARDGLKPVHRRILYSMHELGMTPDKGYSKCARVVGDVLGRFHPHGDASVYDALVRMAQDFSMGLTLIDGQGNFGSVDGDPAASMRYTESRMTRAGASLLADIEKDTVDFQPNYDGREQEPVVLPARIPNLLVNGAGGIAVGMATNIPPHNLGEIVDACLALIDDPALPLEQLLEIVPGPDFPTGGEIIGRTSARDALITGRGSVVVRAKTHIETVRGREAIVVDELPYQVNKKTLQERISELVREKRIEGIAHMQGRVRPRRHAVGDRVPARRHAGRGAEPAASVHGHAVQLRREHAGAEPRPAGADGPPRAAGPVPGVPGGGGGPPHPLRAQQGARSGPRPGRLGHRRGQHRRSDRYHPLLGGPRGGARASDGAGLAGGRHGPADPPDRGPSHPHD
jgi:hypothetical protein